MTGIDVFGDVHGHLGPLLRTAEALGYDTNQGWSHPDARAPVFLGDLVDRGPDSIGVVELVRGLMERGDALCLMGNHEYNLLEWWFAPHAQRRSKERTSNAQTRRQILAVPDRWASALAFLARLPIAIDLPQVRLVHSCWHTSSVRMLRATLTPTGSETVSDGRAAWLQPYIIIGSPFDERGPRPDLPRWGVDGSHATRHEVLMKGLESAALGPVTDAEGRQWPLARLPWWQTDTPEIDTSKRTVFGHYWNIPPAGADGPAAPVEVLGSKAERRWLRTWSPQRGPAGRVELSHSVRHVCVDYQGMHKGGVGGCVGAWRWPEHEVVWST